MLIYFLENGGGGMDMFPRIDRQTAELEYVLSELHVYFTSGKSSLSNVKCFSSLSEIDVSYI